MAEPNEVARSMLKRLVRHLVGHGRLVQVISEERNVKAPRVDKDSDYAGFVQMRKSTTCDHLFHGVNLFKAGRWTQGTRSLSVAESEFYAGVKVASILLGAKNMMIDFGEDVGRCVFFLVQTAAQPRVSWRDVELNASDIHIARCFGYKTLARQTLAGKR